MTDRIASAQLKIHSLLNRTFGSLQVKALLPERKCRVHCLACHKDKILDKRNLYRLKSCGCLRSKLIGIGHTTHGAKTAAGGTAEYVCWRNIKARCHNKRREDYLLYGGRGIRVCRRWSGKNGFISFLFDMGLKPDPKLSLDRIDNNKNYSKGNCRWADAHTQRVNQRRVQRPHKQKDV